jgi:hypothetical protein
MDGITSLKEAIRTVPIPGSPPPGSREGAAVGLAFLDMALRQNHIRRLTERLTLVEHRAATRTTEVDIRLSLLDNNQRESSRLFEELTSRSPAIESNKDEDGTGRSSIWVPVTRISRRSVAPIDVVDSSGAKLPRLTQYETSRLLASGLYRLLRGILSSQPESRRDTELGRFLYRLDESRWLVHAALIALLTERSGPVTELRHAPTPKTVGGHGQQYRTIAIDIFEKYGTTLLDTYVGLLDVALNDYLLVVALDAGIDDHLLSYDSPLHSGKPSPASMLRRLSQLEPNRYRVEYHTDVPASLRSYHVVAETELGVHIKTMSLTTDADEAFTRELATDLRTLANRLEAEGRRPSIERKLLELELQSALGRLAELSRTRRWEADQAGMTIAVDRLPATDLLAWASSSGEAVQNEDGQVRGSLLRHPNVTSGTLKAASEEILSEQLGSDYSLENDPAASRAHAYWRRASPHLSSEGHTSIRCVVTLSDATGTRPRSVIAYVVAVVLTIYATGCFLHRSPWPYPGFVRHQPLAAFQADAVVAVLLLVPGFLYTRLDLPASHTVIGHLRAMSRHVAQLCIGSAVLLAAGVAAGLTNSALRLLMAVCTLVPILSAAPLLLRLPKRRTAPYLGAPSWLRPSKIPDRAMSADATFYSSGADQ